LEPHRNGNGSQAAGVLVEREEVVLLESKRVWTASSVMFMENGQIVLSSGVVSEEFSQKNIIVEAEYKSGTNLDAVGDIILAHDMIRAHDYCDARCERRNTNIVLKEVFTSSRPSIIKRIPLFGMCPNETPFLLLPPSQGQIAAWIQKITALLAITPLLPELSRLVAMLML
jgi:hypothetical protein